MRRKLQDLAHPLPVCSARTMIDEIWQGLAAGKPVAVFLEGRWKLALPEHVVGVPGTRLVLDLDLPEALAFPPETPLSTALERIETQQPRPEWVLVVKGEELVGGVSRVRLLEAVLEEAREAEGIRQIAETLLRAVKTRIWRAVFQKEEIESFLQSETIPSRPLPKPILFEIFGPDEIVSGYKLEEIVRDGLDFWFSRIHPEDRAKVWKNFREAFLTGLSPLFYRLRHREGHWIWVETYIAVQADPERNRITFCGVSRDVTAQWVQRQAKEIAQQIFRAIAQRQPGQNVTVHALNLLAQAIPFDARIVFRVRPDERVEGEVTWVRPEHRKHAESFKTALKEFLESTNFQIRQLNKKCPLLAQGLKVTEPFFLSKKRALSCPSDCPIFSAGWRPLGVHPCGEVVGYRSVVFLLSYGGFRPLRPEHRDLLLEVAPAFQSVGRAILYERVLKQANQALQKNQAALEGLFQASTRLAKAVSYEQVFSIAVDSALEILEGAVAVGCFLGEQKQIQWTVIAAQRPLDQQVLDQLREKVFSFYPNFSSAIPDPFARPKNVLIREASGQPVIKLHSFVGQPIRIYHEKKEEEAGILIVGWEQEDTKRVRDAERILRTLCSVVGNTLERIREAQQEERERLRRVIEIAPLGVVVVDREGRLVLSNPPGREFLRMLYPDRFKGEGREQLAKEVLPEIWEFRPSGQWKEQVLEGPRKVVLEWTAVPMRLGPDGEVRLVVIRDVTEKKEMEFRQIQQARLAAIGQLAAGLAHEFNNLLSPILGYADLLLTEEKLSEEGQEAVQTIREQATAAGKLVREILDLTKRGVEEQLHIDLPQYLERILATLSRILPSSVTLRYKTRNKPLFVQANPTALQQILMNLILNACAAMPSGGVIEVEVSDLELRPGQKPPIPELGPGRWVVLKFSDTGKGIPKEHLPYIFEPFFTTRAAEGGTGLGLAQVYGLVQQMTGFITVESEVGKGTTFIIYLPFAEEAKEQPTPPPAKQETPSLGSKRRILFVEDSASVRRVITKLLEKMGYEVVAVENGKRALEMYQKVDGKIDLLLTDWVMPQLGGRELIQELRKKDPNLKVAVLSAYPVQEQAENAQLQIDAWLIKPVSSQQLAATLRTLFQEENPEKNLSKSTS